MAQSRVEKSLLLMALFVATLTVGARANAGATPFRVGYVGAEGCPKEDFFTHEILARTNLARPATPTDKAVRFELRLWSARGSSRGELATQDIDGTVSVRSIEDESCEEVVSALALIAALILDPDASTGPAHKAKPPELAPAQPKECAIPEQPRAESPEQVRTFLTTAQNVEAPASAAVTRSPRPIDFVNGAHVGLQSAIAPVALASGALYVEALAKDSASLGWAARLSFLYAPTTTVSVAQGQATFEWTALRAEGCPLRVATKDRVLSFYPCAGLEIGRTHATGLKVGDIVHPQADDPLWLAFPVVGRIRLEIASILSLELEGGPIATIMRQKFVFMSPNETIHQVPAFGAVASLGAGVHFR
jgi:hypothetical protein